MYDSFPNLRKKKSKKAILRPFDPLKKLTLWESQIMTLKLCLHNGSVNLALFCTFRIFFFCALCVQASQMDFQLSECINIFRCVNITWSHILESVIHVFEILSTNAWYCFRLPQRDQKTKTKMEKSKHLKGQLGPRVSDEECNKKWSLSIIPGGFLRLFIVPGKFSWLFSIRAEHQRCEVRLWEYPKRYPLDLYLGPTIPPLGLAGFGLVMMMMMCKVPESKHIKVGLRF